MKSQYVITVLESEAERHEKCAEVSTEDILIDGHLRIAETLRLAACYIESEYDGK